MAAVGRGMFDGKLESIRMRHKEFGYIFIYKADTHLASQLPELSVPRMTDAARAAFRAVLKYEVPPANSSLFDFLGLAEARGFCVHPSDWVPNPDKDPNHMPLYQPWSDWLSENYHTPFHRGNSLNSENWHRWKPSPRLWAFRALLAHNPQAALELLKKVAPTETAASRLALLGEVNVGGSFYGNGPGQVPIVKFFQADRSAKIRAAADEELKRMEGLETEEAHAVELAKHLALIDGKVRYKVTPEPQTSPFSVNYHCATFDLLAKAMELHPHDLARHSDFKELGSNFVSLLVRTGDIETRSIFASRMLEQCPPEEIAFWLFRGVPRPLWERGLFATFKSNYYCSVQEFLGRETGTLDMSQMHELSCFKYWEQSVIDELEKGKLPVNTSYDPLRALGLVVNKHAANSIIDRAITLGMKADHPRLTMLRFNLAL
jgi:hypothetical protein